METILAVSSWFVAHSFQENISTMSHELRTYYHDRRQMMSKPNVGDKAPEFTLLASNGQKVSLKDFKGKKNVVLYFYPKDDTSGCTVEACGFRDSIKNIETEDAVVLGVSPDGINSHEKFIKKFGLSFLLLSDEDHKMSTDYGVWIEKSMYGRKYMGKSFLIQE